MPDAADQDSDETLLARFARGDVEAFSRLYRRHEMRTWRYLYRHLRHRQTAEELMQEVWLAVAKDAGRYEPRARFTTWLLTIAHHRLIDALRARRVHISLEAMTEADAPLPAQLADSDSDPLVAVTAQSEASILQAALAQLPQEQRDALLLQWEGGLSVEEIAKLTGSRFETVKSRLRYARERLRQLLAPYI